MPALRFRLVDVFAASPLSGNGLTVIIDDEPLPAATMQLLTQELRQFETVFLTPGATPERWRARVFTMEEELDFAGHPLIGAAAVLHEQSEASDAARRWTFELNHQSVELESRREGDSYIVTMHQARIEFGAVATEMEAELLAAIGLSAETRDPALPLELASAGLPYLIIPVTGGGLANARVAVENLEPLLAKAGAKFAYVLDARGREGRTWDNRGAVEDIATGSAAGPCAAYLVRHGLARAGDEIILRQGRFAGRPSEMRLRVEAGVEGGVLLTGEVRMIANGIFDPGVGC